MGIIYHGSENIIEKPEFGLGSSENDYGLGFYCTESVELAKEWACVNDDVNGYANKYNFDFDDMNVIDLTDGGYTILNWMALLVKNRIVNVKTPIAAEAKRYLIENFSVDLTNVDVIIGHRADDSYFSFAKDFINNAISVRQLAKAMELGELGKQIVLISQKAFANLKYESSEIADRKEYYAKRVTRDEKARSEYLEGDMRNVSVQNDIFMLDVMRKGLKNGDKIL